MQPNWRDDAMLIILLVIQYVLNQSSIREMGREAGHGGVARLNVCVLRPKQS